MNINYKITNYEVKCEAQSNFGTWRMNRFSFDTKTVKIFVQLFIQSFLRPNTRNLNTAIEINIYLQNANTRLFRYFRSFLFLFSSLRTNVNVYVFSFYTFIQTYQLGDYEYKNETYLFVAKLGRITEKIKLNIYIFFYKFVDEFVGKRKIRT